MRRNSATLLKYLVYAILFLILGPLMLRFLFGEHQSEIDPRPSFQRAAGLPESPEEMRKAHDIHVRVQEAVEHFAKSQVTLKYRNASQSNPPTSQPVHNLPRGLGSIKKAPPAAEMQHKMAPPGTKIDWHNQEQIALEAQRTGPGEQGTAVILSAAEEKLKDDLYKVNGFNAYASDKISLERAIKDIRHPDCKKKKHLANLPTVSVIVPFHNEHWTTLLRTAASVLLRSPKHLIHEVLLVDDFSSKDFTKKPLDDYLATHFDGKVKAIHAKRREGLIRTRILGAKHATGDVLIFLDSHCEANVNWLPPLLEPIAENYKAVVCPFIDVIDFETFAYRAQDEGARGAFDWEFFYKRLPLLPEDLAHPAEPFKSPVMAGGLFAIHQKWFWELGGYDPGLDIWGGEQYELSFKLWQCGGYMVDAPCSRVGHIYRKFAPFPNPGIGDFVGRNYRRVAAVWMDEYAEHLYRRRPHYRNIETGDISAQVAIRKKLNCKPFKWFMQEVAFDLPKHYPPVEPPTIAEGELRSAAAPLCVDTRFRNQNERFGLETCLKDSAAGGGEQHLELTWHKDIRPRKRAFCFDVSQSILKSPVILWNCHGMKGNQHFKYNLKTKQIFHPISHQCLDCDVVAKEIFMNPCVDSQLSQQWLWENLNATEVQKEWLDG